MRNYSGTRLVGRGGQFPHLYLRRKDWLRRCSSYLSLTSFLVNLQPIAHSWLSNDELRACWVGFDLAAEVADVDM
jgi:hypothetical protein